MSDFLFPVKTTLRIDWSELDFLGHVNNISFFKYIQASRINCLERMGFTVISPEITIGPILASAKCDFRQSLYYPGQVFMQARVEFIKTTSFGIAHQLFNDKNELAAEAHDVIVLYDYQKNEKVKIPAELRARIQSIAQ
ncbi:MAG: thioesterase family protein [Bacteroidota bacterium]